MTHTRLLSFLSSIAATIILSVSSLAAEPGKIAYLSKFGEVRLVNANGTGDIVAVEPDDFYIDRVQLSGDGKWVAFSGSDNDSGNSGIWVARAAAAGPSNAPVLVASNADIGYRFSWHPQNKFLSFTRRDSGSLPQIFLLPITDNDGNLTPESGANPAVQVTGYIAHSYYFDSAFSPDGKSLAITYFSNVIVLPVVNDTGSITPQSATNVITTVTSTLGGTVRSSMPCWSPDGTKLVMKRYAINEDLSSLVVLNVRETAGGPLTPEGTANPAFQLSTPTEDEHSTNAPTWSPDGTLIAFSDQAEDAMTSATIYNVYTLRANEQEGVANVRFKISTPENGDGQYPAFMQVGGPGVPVPPTAGVPKNLAHWWPGNDTGADVFGNKHLLSNGSTAAGFTAGTVGRAFSFNGTSQSFATETATTLNTLPLTIEGWIKPALRNDIAANAVRPPNVISNDRYGHAGHGFGAFVFEGGTSELVIEVQSPDLSYHLANNVALEADVWAHVAVVYTEGNAKIYVNGQQVDSVDYTQGDLDGEEYIRVGRHNEDTSYGTLRFFKGAVDELAVVQRAMTAQEIASLAAASENGKRRDDAARQFVVGGSQEEDAKWTYGKLPAGGINTGNFALMEEFTTQGTFQSWLPSGSGNRANVNWNSGAETYTFNGAGGPEIVYAPGQLGLHPGQDNTYSVVRWTAPADGRFAVCGSFIGIDVTGATTDVHIYHNGTSLYDGLLEGEFLGDGHSFTRLIDAAAGDQVDFIVGSQGNFSYDSTAVLASVVPAGSSVAPRNPHIVTSTPLTTDRQWLFTAERANDAADLTLRVQYATYEEPNNWLDLPVHNSTNTMAAPAEGSEEWSLAVSPLPLDAGNYFFRIVADSPETGEVNGARFGAEALGGEESGAIAINAPGQPPPPPIPQPMPPTVAMTLKINNKANVTSTKQGASFDFLATQPVPAGLPADLRVRVQYSTTPNDDNSWEELDDSRMDPGSMVKTARSYRLLTDRIPAGTGVYFRTSTTGTSRATSYGPIVNGVLKPIGPITIGAGPIWDDVGSRVVSSSDTGGTTAFAGDILRYRVKFENEGTAPATNVVVTMIAPTGTKVTGFAPGDSPKGSATRVVWTIPSVAPGVEIEKWIEAQVTAKIYTVITQKAANITVKANEIALRQAIPEALKLGEQLTTRVLPPLRIDIDASPNHVRAGEVVEYSIRAENQSADIIRNGLVSFRVPVGMSVEYLRLKNGNGDFTDTQITNPSPSGNPSLESWVYGKQQLIQWKLDELKGKGVGKNYASIEFALRAAYDLPHVYYSQGVGYETTLSASDYNFEGTTPGGQKIVSFKGAAPEVNVPLTVGFPPTMPPNLTLTKTAKADGAITGSSPTLGNYGINIPGIAHAATVLPGSRLTYQLRYSNNTGASAGRNVTIHDEIPQGLTFTGFIRKDGVLINSAFGYTFRNKDGLPIPSGGEPWNDLDNDGKVDAKEWTDTNGNKKYDAFTDTKFIDINVGSLGGGDSGTISYECVADSKLKPGTVIYSRSGGAIIPKTAGGQQYEGFSITSENLMEPVPGGPLKLISLVVAPVTFDLQQPAVLRGALVPGGTVEFEVPFRVNGGDGLAFQNVALKVAIPKHYDVNLALSGLVDIAATFPTNGAPRPLKGPAPVVPTLSAPDKAGVRILTFGLDTLLTGRYGVARFALTVADPMPAELLTADGFVKLPPALRAEMSGATIPGAITGAPERSMAPRAPAPVKPTLLPVASVLTMVPVLSPAQTELFVGRVAPLSVERGQEFPLTVFFGNATNRLMQTGQVVMKIPPGTSLVHVGPTTWHYANPASGRFERAGYYKLLPNATKPTSIVFEALDMSAHDAAAVTVTLRVDDNFNGGSIEDSSLYTKSANAFGKAAPKMNIEVRSTNFLSGLFNFFGNWLGGMFGNYSPAAKAALDPYAANFNSNSRQIQVGGASFVHVTNGSVVLPLLGNRVMAIGPNDKVQASGYNVIADDGSNCVAVGDSYTPGFQIVGVSAPNRSAWSPGDIIDGLRHNSTSIVAAGAGNIVAAGAGNLIGTDGASLISNANGLASGITLRPIAANIVAAGAGNIVAAGAGNIVAAGSLNLLANGGTGLIGTDGASIVAAGAGNLISQDGGTLVAAGAGNIVAAGAGNLVNAGGLNMLANDLPKLIGTDGASLQAIGGSSILPTKANSLFDSNAAGILSHNGGLILSHNGGL